MTPTNEIYTYTDIDGEKIAVDNRTGEAIRTITMTVPVGTIAYTPAQQEAYRLRKEREHIHYAMKSDFGTFYFSNNNCDTFALKPATAARLIYLCSYLGYKDNALMMTQKTPMRKTDLQKVLHVDKTTVSRFINEVSPKFITIDSNDYLYANTDLFKRGRIGKIKDDTFYRKIYIKSVRKLYEQTSTSKHKHLGYVFQLLPYINIQYNILCHDIAEDDLHSIEPITLKEFCRIINFDTNNIGRLYNAFRSIVFDVNGHKERFVSFVSDGGKLTDANIYINPHIVYNGNRYNEIEVLAAFCKTD